MEVFIIVILIVVIGILLVRRSDASGNIAETNNVLKHLTNQTNELRKQIIELNYKVESGNRDLGDKLDKLQQGATFVAQQPGPPPTPAPVQEYIPPIVEEATEPDIYVEEPAEVPEEAFEPIQETPEMAMNEEELAAEPEPPVTERTTHRPEPVIEESFIDKWLRNNPDLEKFIGENLINKIGIAVLVLGIAFFVKYAIDKDWINETGRVCIGMGCGALLVGLAHFLRNSYRSFSSVLAGGGIAVFYFTIAFGFHQYHLMSQTAAFIIMVIITAFAITLSVLYDKLELAIIATVGGFITPFLLSTGEGNYVVLFTYLIILDAGVLLLAYFKRWPAINIIALAFTEIIYAGWLITTINGSKPVSYPTALLFASVFYFLFLAINMINQLKNKDRFKPFDFTILLLITSTYFAGGMTLLHYWHNGAYQGVFTLLLGMMNLVLAYIVVKKGQADKNLLFLLIGITLTFITLTIPIQLHGHAITLFWSAEFVLLYWLSVYSGIRVFKYSSLIICALSLISLMMDWEQAGRTAGLHVIYNDVQGIVTNIVAIAAFATWSFLLRKNKEETIGGISGSILHRVPFLIAAGLLYITCIFGVNLAFRGVTQSYAMPNVYHRMITEIFALAFILLAQKRKEPIYTWLQLGATAVCVLAFFTSIPDTTELRAMVLSSKASWVHFFMHWADSVLLGFLLYKNIQLLRNKPEEYGVAQNAINIIFTAVILALLSVELMHIYVIIGYRGNNVHALEVQYGKAGLTVIWGLCSFALMWLGMKHQNKSLRIISLVLFSIVLLKLFTVDISGISEGGKILAFIFLGVLLLTVSFMYQKLKKIIIDDKKDEA